MHFHDLSLAASGLTSCVNQRFAPFFSWFQINYSENMSETFASSVFYLLLTKKRGNKRVRLESGKPILVVLQSSPFICMLKYWECECERFMNTVPNAEHTGFRLSSGCRNNIISFATTKWMDGCGCGCAMGSWAINACFVYYFW